MTIELYVFPPSPRAFKVMAVANHLGIDWTMRVVDLAKGEQQSPEFASLNPNMRMPVLKDGNYVLWESNAIAQYLANQRPEGGLLPADGKGRLDVTRWQFWDLAHWDPAGEPRPIAALLGRWAHQSLGDLATITKRSSASLPDRNKHSLAMVKQD